MFGFLKRRIMTPREEIAKAKRVPRLDISPIVLIGVKPAIKVTKIVTKKQLR
jgi:hypothetical protein